MDTHFYPEFLDVLSSVSERVSWLNYFSTLWRVIFTPAAIIGKWSSSHFRLFLCSGWLIGFPCSWETRKLGLHKCFYALEEIDVVLLRKQKGGGWGRSHTSSCRIHNANSEFWYVIICKRNRVGLHVTSDFVMLDNTLPTCFVFPQTDFLDRSSDKQPFFLWVGIQR